MNSRRPVCSIHNFVALFFFVREAFFVCKWAILSNEFYRLFLHLSAASIRRTWTDRGNKIGSPIIAIEQFPRSWIRCATDNVHRTWIHHHSRIATKKKTDLNFRICLQLCSIPDEDESRQANKGNRARKARTFRNEFVIIHESSHKKKKKKGRI